MKSILLLIVACLGMAHHLHADPPKLPEATEKDSRLHSDGKGWGLNKAKITDVKRPRAQGPYDVVHFNMGLHGWQEGRIKPGTFEPLTKAYVEVIKAALPKAKIIWASSTPVTVQGKPADIDPEVDPVIVDQNRMAAKVMEEMKVPVNDFYNLLVEKRDLARGDRFHWKGPAYDLLAKKVVESVLRELGIAQPQP